MASASCRRADACGCFLMRPAQLWHSHFGLKGRVDPSDEGSTADPSFTKRIPMAASPGPAASVKKAPRNDPEYWKTIATTTGTIMLPNCQKPANNPAAEPASVTPDDSATIAASKGLY